MSDNLQHLAIFSGFADSALADFLNGLIEQSIDAGETLFYAGDPGDVCYVVLSGVLDVFVKIGGEDTVLQTVYPGQLFGEVALLDKAPRSASVRAREPSRLLLLDADDFATLMRASPEAVAEVIRDSSARLRRTSYDMVRGLEAKNAELRRAYEELKVAQAELIRLNRIEEELAVARRIQSVFLPRHLPQPAGWEVAAFNRGAQEVGGDFFDCIELPGGRLGLVIADVSGKGVPAALFVALTRSLLRSVSLALRPPPGEGLPSAADVLGGALWQTNDYIAREHGESNMFITTFYGLLEPWSGELSFVNAGHNPPLLLGADGGVRPLEARAALPLGILEDQQYETTQATLVPGETLVAFTDGITEALSADDQFFGDERLAALLATLAGRPAGELAQAVVAEVDAFANNAPQSDDMSLLIVRRLP